MLACNAVVWTMFVKALHQSKSSLVATIISSTSNYLLTVTEKLNKLLEWNINFLLF